MSNLAWVVTTITSVTTRHFLLESPANRELTSSTKLSRTAAGWGQVHPHKNRRLFLVYLEFVLFERQEDIPPNSWQEARTSLSIYFWPHCAHLPRLPASWGLTPPSCKLSSHTRFSLRYLFRVFKKKKPIMNPPPLTQYDSDASSTNDWEWMTNGVWMISRCFPERGRLAPHQSAAWHATWRQRRREMKHGYLLEIAIIERLRPMTSNESPFSPEWTLTQPSFTHVGMTVTHRRPGLGLCARHLCLHSVVTDRVTTVSQKKKEKKKGHFFAPSVKSTQIGLLDEWTCLCPFHAGCPFVMPPLLRKQQRRGLYLLSESSWCSSSLCWWGRVHLPSWISSRSLNNFYDWAWLTRKAEKPRLTFLWVWMFFNLTLSAGLLTSHHHFYPAPGGFSWLHRF